VRPRALEAAAVAVVLAAQGAVLAGSLDRATSYDEGVYLASLDALQAGEELGTEVFASQPPGWYLLLRALAFFGDSVPDLRLAMLGVALAGTVAAWALGRALAGPVAGIGAAALLAVAPPWPTEAVRVTADVPSVVLALAGLALALRLKPAGGAVLALAVSVKLFALTAAVPLLGFARRRQALVALAGAAVVAAAFLIAYAGSLGAIWHDAVGFHDAARTVGPTVGDNAGRVLRFLDWRTPFGWLVPLGAVAAAARVRSTWPLWLWAAAAAVFLVWHRPLLDHHLVLLAAPLAVAAGTALGAARLPRAALALLALAVAAGFVQEQRRLADNDGPEPPDVVAAARLLAESTRPGELVGSDLPIVPHLAGRRLPGELVDTSTVRFASGSLTPEEVLDVLEREHIGAVVVGRSFRDYPDLLAALERRYPVERRAGEITVRLRAAP
jgi:hypothetical protein